MSIRFYNTMTKTKQEFKPITPGMVTMYVCGPTVYNLIHIGNARPMIVFDTLRRYLTYKGYEVNYVSNFTDVDDKIIQRANEEGVTAAELSQKYIRETKKDMADMNVLPATTHPLATQEIDGMINLIRDLEEKGFAYNVNGTVYFRTRKDPRYGELSHKNLDDLRRSGEGRSARFCAVEAEEGRRTLLGEPVGRGKTGLAHGMLCDVTQVSPRDNH